MREYGAETLKCDSSDSIQITARSYGQHTQSDALFGDDEPKTSNELLAVHETGYAEELPTIVDEQKVSAIALKIQLFEELAKKPQEIAIKGPFGRHNNSTTPAIEIQVKPAVSLSDVPALDSSDSESGDDEQNTTSCYVDDLGNEISLDDVPRSASSSYLNSLVPDLDAVSDFEEKKNSFFPNMAGISLRNQVEDVVGFYMTGISDETSTAFNSLKGKDGFASDLASEAEFQCQDLWDSYDQYLTAKSNDTRFKALVDFRSNLQLFFAKSERYAKTIVDEIHLPYSEKSIRPVDAGGVAGGIKYVHDGIFFKFAVDLYDIFGGDRNAAKTAGKPNKEIHTPSAGH